MSKFIETVCNYCKGKGKVDEDCDVPPNFRTCPVCGGHGRIRVPNNYRRCTACGGSGRKYDSMDPMGSFSQCRRCKGSGWMPPPRIVR